jgi:phospholipase/carboxylesterase
MLDFIVKETANNAVASVIWMHGLGSEVDHFADKLPELGLPCDAAIRFIFPHAPERHISVYNRKMRAWCNLTFL